MSTQLEIPYQYGDYYDRFAEIYRERQESGLLYFNNAIDIPATMRELRERSSSIRNSAVLDVGSGLGTYSKLLAELGASVTAIDVSARMTEITRGVCDGLDVRCLNQDFFEHSVDKSSRYDYVVAGFMLGYFRDLDRAFHKFKKLTKRGSVVIASSIHPLKTPFEKNGDSKKVAYFGRRRYVSDFLTKDEPLELSRWIIEEVTRAAYNYNFAVDKILEPRPALSYDAYGSKQLYEHYSYHPSVAIYVLRRR